MKRFRLIKNIRKGIEGAFLSGGAVGGAVEVLQTSQDIDISDVEHAIAVLVAAGVGFVFKSVKNWLKNRNT